MENKPSPFVTQSCPLCGWEKPCPLFEVRFASEQVLKLLKIENPPPVFVNECLTCSHHFISPILSKEKLSEYYLKLDSEYYSYLDDGKNHQALLNGIIVREVEKMKSGGRVLEIGSGYGHLLGAFERSNWQVSGIEPSPSASRYAKEVMKLNVKNELFAKNLYPAECFDAVVMADVVEHIHDPLELMSEVNRILVPGGVVAISTGNFSSFASRILKQYWGYFSSYEHINFYSPASMEYLLNKTDFDLSKLLPISHCGSVYMESKMLLLGLFKKLRFVIKQIYSRKFDLKRLSGPQFLFYDHMLVIGLKR